MFRRLGSICATSPILSASAAQELAWGLKLQLRFTLASGNADARTGWVFQRMQKPAPERLTPPRADRAFWPL